MSTRINMTSIISLQPIIDAVGSNNESLLTAVLDQHRKELTEYYDGEEPDEEELEDFREYAENMIKCKPIPAKEPGAWNYVISALSECLELKPERLPLDDWKHFYVWEDYKSLVKPELSSDALHLLNFLEHGRPLRGQEIDHDGCVFAWLAPTEVISLHEALLKIEPTAEMEARELDEFHEELLECLHRTRERDAVLFLAAH